MIRSSFDSRGFYLFFCNAVAQYSLLFLLIWSFAFSFFFSILSGLLILIAFLSGVLVVNVLWTKKSFHVLSFIEASYKPINRASQQNTGCSVCGQSLCKRQNNIRDNQPWLGLNIPKDVDQAIQDLLNKILNEFITSWHNKFTKDDSFIMELRRGLRHAVSILIRRLWQVDIGEVMVDQLLTTTIRHINDYIYISKISLKDNIEIESAAVKYLNKKLHPAVYNRKSELQYLRRLSDLLSSYLIQPSQLKCMIFRVLIRELLAGWVFLPLTDTLCDPLCINSLLLVALNYESSTAYTNNPIFTVQLLHRFVMPSKGFAGKKFPLQTSLSAMIKDQKLLYTFMQFLKREGSVHLLQFCLDVEEFSKKILNPELSQTEMESLYREAWDLFSVYFKIDSPDNIHFPKHIVQQLEQVLEKGPSNVSKLRTNPVLFKAYEVVYIILEENFCPLFYMSDYYFPFLCGERQKAKFAKEYSSPLQPGSPVKGRSNKKPTEPSAIGKFSSKFHKLLQFQAVEGKAFFNDVALDVAETECVEDMQVEGPEEVICRDMSTWQVTIPTVTTQQDSNSKPYPVFILNVVDVGTKGLCKTIFDGQNSQSSLSSENINQSAKIKWNVRRRYNDFYLLQAKLAEFHGEFEDGTQLPPKTGMFSPRGSEFLENRRQIFESYLQKLLQKPNLRGSDLLYFFLKSPVEFSSCLSAQDGIGKIIRRSVEPIKLRKERGQHLENFLNLFLASTEGIKRSGKMEWQDVSVESERRKRTITKSIFGNNFEAFLGRAESGSGVQKEILLLGPWDCIFYCMSELMGASSHVMQGAMTLKRVLGPSSDSVIKAFVRKKLEAFLQPARVSHLIRLLQDALFSSGHQSQKQDRQVLRDKVLADIEKATNNTLIHWFLPNCGEGFKIMVDSFQHPILSKHLCYCIFDEVVRILFPELATST